MKADFQYARKGTVVILPRHLLRPGQKGASLIVALLLLVAAMLLGVSAADIALQGEKASRNDRDRQIAFQAAEAALIDAEIDLENSSRSHIFSSNSALGFPDLPNQTCQTGENNIYLGLCKKGSEADAPIWQSIDFLETSESLVHSVPYGKFTGQPFQVGKGSLPAKLSRYVIELMPYTKSGESAEVRNYIYRVTAIGFGAHETTMVVLQMFYRKDDK